MNWIGWSGIALVAAASGAAPAQDGRAAEAAQALRLAAEQVEAQYVDAAAAPAIARRLRDAARTLKRQPRHGKALAAEMTALLRPHDPHFKFDFNVDAAFAAPSRPPSPANVEAARVQSARVINFGVLKAERLPGNVGLIEIEKFYAPADMQRPLAAAMDLLANCDAMIVDLRHATGGHARGVAMAVSYFLPEAPNRLLVRISGRDPSEALEIKTLGLLKGERFLGKPVYVLTGPSTFSAAEMFVTAMQREAKALIVGTKTRGGGNPSALVKLTPHYAVLIPTSRSVDSSGKSWNGVGVTPDIPVKAADALVAARRAALSALLAASPNDLLADNWRTILAELAAPAAAAASSKEGSVQ